MLTIFIIDLFAIDPTLFDLRRKQNEIFFFFSSLVEKRFSFRYFCVRPLIVNAFGVRFDQFFEFRSQNNAKRNHWDENKSWAKILRRCIGWTWFINSRHFDFFTFVIQIILLIKRIWIIRWQRTANGFEKKINSIVLRRKTKTKEKLPVRHGKALPKSSGS